MSAAACKVIINRLVHAKIEGLTEVLMMPETRTAISGEKVDHLLNCLTNMELVMIDGGLYEGPSVDEMIAMLIDAEVLDRRVYDA